MQSKRSSGRMKYTAYLLQHMKPYYGKMLLSITMGILKEFSIISAVGICAYMAAMAIRGINLYDHSWLLYLAVCVVGRCAAVFFESYLSHDVAYHVLVDFRVKIYNQFERLCPDILLKNRSGQIASTLMNDVETLEWFYGHTVGFAVVVIIVCVSIIIFLATLHWSLALAMFICILLILWIPFLMKNKADKQGALSRHRLGEANAVTLEGINGMNEILTLNWQEKYKQKNRRFMEKLTEIQVKYANRMGTEASLLQIAAGMSAVAINILSIWLTLNGKLSVEWFAVIGTTAWLAFSPVLELCGLAGNFGIIFAASERISNIICTKPLVTDSGKDISQPIEPSVVFSKVVFRYDEASENVLDEVSFKVSKAEMTALIGESGAGKTTCLNLLSRLWDVKEGSIMIGGMDIRHMSLNSLHSIISVVPQDVYLFNTTIKENISLGKPNAAFNEIIESAKMARIHNFIISLPDKYDTLTGERGVQLSGGQRQRIAIARALLKDTPILIMDEAVSNLDAKTDQEILETIRSLTHKKTIIMSTHRLSTIMKADRIIVLDKGKIVQEGTHSQLMEQEGYYKNLILA